MWRRRGLALWREGCRHRLLALVNHVALMMALVLVRPHHVRVAEGVVVVVPDLLKVAHGHCGLDALVVGGRLRHCQFAEVRIHAGHPGGVEPGLEGARRGRKRFVRRPQRVQGRQLGLGLHARHPRVLPLLLDAGAALDGRGAIGAHGRVDVGRAGECHHGGLGPPGLGFGLSIGPLCGLRRHLLLSHQRGLALLVNQVGRCHHLRHLWGPWVVFAQQSHYVVMQSLVGHVFRKSLHVVGDVAVGKVVQQDLASFVASFPSGKEQRSFVLEE